MSDQLTSQSRPSQGVISRRTALRGAAWSASAVTVVVATPNIAAASPGQAVKPAVTVTPGTPQKYSDKDTKYVEELVGPHCVNTMPQATLEAFGDHGTVTGPTVTTDPEPALKALEEAGIDLAAVTAQLLDDGISQFEDAMTGLLDGIEKKRVEKAGA